VEKITLARRHLKYFFTLPLTDYEIFNKDKYFSDLFDASSEQMSARKN